MVAYLEEPFMAKFEESFMFSHFLDTFIYVKEEKKNEENWGA